MKTLEIVFMIHLAGISISLLILQFLKDAKFLKNLILIIALFIGVNCMAQDSIKVKPVTPAAPVKPKKEHKYAEQFKNTMANVGISLAGAAVMTTGGMVINKAQHDATKD